MQTCFGILTLTITVLGIWGSFCAQQRNLSIHVVDIYREPIEGVILSTQGDGSQSDPTDNSGRTRIALPLGTKPNDVVFLQLVRGITTNAQWVMLSPEGATVPPFDDKPSRFVTVMLISKSDKQFFANRNDLRPILGTRPPPSSDKSGVNAKTAGRSYTVEDAIQGAHAIQALEAQLAKEKQQFIDNLLSLARLRYSSRLYNESVSLYRQVLALREDMTTSMELASALVEIPNYPEAELVYAQILRNQEKNPQADEFSLLPVLESYLTVLKNMNHEAKVSEVQSRIKVIRKKIFDRVSNNVK